MPPRTSRARSRASPLVGKAKLTNVVVIQGHPSCRQQQVAIALDKIIGADQLDAQPRALGEHINLTRDQAKSITQRLRDHQSTRLVERCFHSLTLPTRSLGRT